jgi:phosphonate transport system substrate-binding protein
MSATVRARAGQPLTFGLTPVFLDSDLELLDLMTRYFTRRLGQPVQLVKRRTYQEITAMLLSGQLDAAWICGFPYVQYRKRLTLMAVPTYRGQPLYQSYLIVGGGRAVTRVEELRGDIHAFSDPDSNSGYLVTRHLLWTMKESPDSFFSRILFTYGHRNVIRAVSSGLAQSGSVDGYVWDVMAEREPDLTAGSKVLRRSKLLGFPPIACGSQNRHRPEIKALGEALLDMPASAEGKRILSILKLDGFAPPDDRLFDGIAANYADILA